MVIRDSSRRVERPKTHRRDRELGYISTLAAATLREMGFQHAVALDGGMKAWRELVYPLETGAS